MIFGIRTPFYLTGKFVISGLAYENTRSHLSQEMQEPRESLISPIVTNKDNCEPNRMSKLHILQ